VSRIPLTPVEVRVSRRWYRGTLHSCEVSEDGTTCTGVVAYLVPHGIETGRFPAARMRTLTGKPGCPADHEDQTCGESGGLAIWGAPSRSLPGREKTGGQLIAAEHHVYYGDDRSACEVEVDGTWHIGRIHSWDRDTSGNWSASVAWAKGPGQPWRLERFPCERVRPA
jgi:hypothetical protein